MEKPCHIIAKDDTQGLGRFLSSHSPGVLPMVELIEQWKLAVDERMDVLGRAQIEAVRQFSAERVAGLPHPGKEGGEIGWLVREKGTVSLRGRKLRVERPRLRQKGQGPDGEVPILACQAMQRDWKLGGRMLEILLRGVSTRQYGAVLSVN